MAAPTLDIAYATGLLSLARKQTTEGMAYFKHTFSFVPDDKLDWSPGGKAKPAITIAGHIAASTELMARTLAGRPPVQGGMAEIFGWIFAEEVKVRTREEAIARLDSSAQEFLDALDRLDPEAVAASPEIQFYVELCGRHINMHAGQIDAYQMIWGDDEFHFPG